MTQLILQPQMQIAEWEVELAISGPIAVEKTWSRTVQKGDDFWTPITVRNVADGVKLTIVARAYDRQNANDAAVYFVGKALDVLCLKLKLPFHLSLFEPKFKQFAGHIKRRVTKDEWLDAFSLGRVYEQDRPYFSRSLSWFRKGLTSDDPIDSLLAFWSALEGIGSKYHRPSDRAQLGTVNQICDCFEQLWGPADDWKVIPGKPDIVNQFNEFRNGIAHGFLDVTIETIRQIATELTRYQELVHAFLSDWEVKGEQFEKPQETPLSS